MVPTVVVNAAANDAAISGAIVVAVVAFFCVMFIFATIRMVKTNKAEGVEK